MMDTYLFYLNLLFYINLLFNTKAHDSKNDTFIFVYFLY